MIDIIDIKTIKDYLANASSIDPKYSPIIVLTDLHSPVSVNYGIPLVAKNYTLTANKTNIEIATFILEVMLKEQTNAFAFYRLYLPFANTISFATVNIVVKEVKPTQIIRERPVALSPTKRTPFVKTDTKTVKTKRKKHKKKKR